MQTMNITVASGETEWGAKEKTDLTSRDPGSDVSKANDFSSKSLGDTSTPLDGDEEYVEEEYYEEEIIEESVTDDYDEEPQQEDDSVCVSNDGFSLNVAYEGEGQVNNNRVDLSRLRPKKKAPSNEVAAPDNGVLIGRLPATAGNAPVENEMEVSQLVTAPMDEPSPETVQDISPEPVEEFVSAVEAEVPTLQAPLSVRAEVSAPAQQPEEQPAGQTATHAATTPVASPQQKVQVDATVTPELHKKLSAPISPSRSPTRGVRAPESPSKIGWDKPSWASAKLKPTRKGDVVKQGADLEVPITRIREYVNGETPPGSPKKETSPRSPKRFVVKPPPAPTDEAPKKIEWEKPSWVKAKLRETSKGEIVKAIGDLQNPITNVKKNGMVDINPEASQVLLRPTDKGGAVRLGENLARPITHIERDPMGDINFEANPEFVLHESRTGGALKKGQTLAKPITHVKKHEGRDVNFEANPALLRRTDKGEIVKTKGNLQKAITHVEKDHLVDLNFEANPMILKPTPKGSLLRIGEDLARPITHIARDPMGDINFDANPDFILQKSENSDIVRQGETLANPITFPQKKTSDVNFDAHQALLRPTNKGCAIREGEEITRPITFPNGRDFDSSEGHEAENGGEFVDEEIVEEDISEDYEIVEANENEAAIELDVMGTVEVKDGAE